MNTIKTIKIEARRKNIYVDTILDKNGKPVIIISEVPTNSTKSPHRVMVYPEFLEALKNALEETSQGLEFQKVKV